MMKNVKFGYFRIRTDNDNQNGYVCVAVSRPTKELSDKLPHRAAFSLCSPKDKFSKKKARQIAVARLESWREGKGYINPRTEFITTTNPTSGVIVEAFNNMIRTNKQLPNWLKSGLKNNRVVAGLSLPFCQPKNVVSKTLELVNKFEIPATDGI